MCVRARVCVCVCVCACVRVCVFAHVRADMKNACIRACQSSRSIVRIRISAAQASGVSAELDRVFESSHTAPGNQIWRSYLRMNRR